MHRTWTFSGNLRDKYSGCIMRTHDACGHARGASGQEPHGNHRKIIGQSEEKHRRIIGRYREVIGNTVIKYRLLLLAINIYINY